MFHWTLCYIHQLFPHADTVHQLLESGRHLKIPSCASICCGMSQSWKVGGSSQIFISQKKALKQDIKQSTPSPELRINTTRTSCTLGTSIRYLSGNAASRQTPLKSISASALSKLTKLSADGRAESVMKSLLSCRVIRSKRVRYTALTRR